MWSSEARRSISDKRVEEIEAACAACGATSRGRSKKTSRQARLWAFASPAIRSDGLRDNSMRKRDGPAGDSWRKQVRVIEKMKARTDAEFPAVA